MRWLSHPTDIMTRAHAIFILFRENDCIQREYRLAVSSRCGEILLVAVTFIFYLFIFYYCVVLLLFSILRLAIPTQFRIDVSFSRESSNFASIIKVRASVRSDKSTASVCSTRACVRDTFCRFSLIQERNSARAAVHGHCYRGVAETKTLRHCADVAAAQVVLVVRSPADCTSQRAARRPSGILI